MACDLIQSTSGIHFAACDCFFLFRHVCVWSSFSWTIDHFICQHHFMQCDNAVQNPLPRVLSLSLSPNLSPSPPLSFSLPLSPSLSPTSLSFFCTRSVCVCACICLSFYPTDLFAEKTNIHSLQPASLLQMARTLTDICACCLFSMGTRKLSAKNHISADNRSLSCLLHMFFFYAQLM